MHILGYPTCLLLLAWLMYWLSPSPLGGLIVSCLAIGLALVIAFLFGVAVMIYAAKKRPDEFWRSIEKGNR